MKFLQVPALVLFAATLFPPCTALACIDLQPGQVIEFAAGSAELSAEQRARLDHLFAQSSYTSQPSKYRISVRAFADAPGDFAPASWKPEDLKLAQDRATVLARAARRSSAAVCVERVAMGVAPKGAPQPRTGPDGTQWHSSGLVMLRDYESKDEPLAGVKVESDCGVD